MMRIYIHGRPQGQDSWSSAPAPNDKFYLNPFLDSRIGEDISAVMQVDMWQENSYYSYIHRKNVLEKGNRPSAYFAITICFEKQICTQVATLYDLLENVYSQLCLNNFIEKVGDQERFLVSQFKEKESVLKQITSIIQQNVDKYIAGSLVPITDKMRDTTKATIKTYSIVDVDSPQFISDCSANRVLISPAYSTKDKLPIELKQQMAIIENQRQKVESERNLWQSTAEHQQSENENLTAKQKQLQEQIQTLQHQVATIEGKLAKEYQTQITELQNSRDKLNKELSQEKQQKKNLQEQCDNLRLKLDKIQKGKNPMPNNPDNSQGEDFSYIKEQLQKIKNEVRRMAGRFRFSNTAITLVATMLNSALLIATIVICCLGMQKINNSDNSQGNNVASTTIPVVQQQPCQQHQKVQEPPIEILPDYSKVRINIENFNGKNLKVGQQYTIAIKGVDSPQNYKWKVDGIDVVLDKNQLTVRSTGEITISCIDSHNYIVKQRKISAE